MRSSYLANDLNLSSDQGVFDGKQIFIVVVDDQAAFGFPLR